MKEEEGRQEVLIEKERTKQEKEKKSNKQK
jgi:hypothetical protein